MIRWLDVSGRHVILRPNQNGKDFPLIPVEYDGTQQPTHHRPGRLVLEPIRPELMSLSGKATAHRPHPREKARPSIFAFYLPSSQSRAILRRIEPR